ncbi:MAG: hypothetical protein M3P33_00020, partial [bacterium]|nr:hypothetical protein [bacterium]
MLKIISTIFVALFFSVIYISLGANSKVNGAICTTADCSKKEIGTFDGISFIPIIPPQTLIKDVSYWVKLTIKGQSVESVYSPTPSASSTVANRGADIMLVQDTSSSMTETINRYQNNTTTTIPKHLAARNSLNKFIDLSDEGSDYIGVGSFNYCDSYTNQNGPFVWGYEGISTDINRYVGFGALN